MAKKILQKQIVQTDLWKNTIESTKELIAFSEKLDDQFKQLGKTSKQIVSNSSKPTFEGLKETTEEVEKLNEAFEAKIKLDKERKKLEDELLKTQKKLKEEQEKLNKVVKENVDSYEELNKETKKAEKIAKELAQQYGKTDARTQDAIKSFSKLKNELIKVNKVVAENVKDTQKKLQLEERLKNLTSEEAKELAELSLQIQEQNKLNKELAKEKLGLLSIYQKESKRLNDLRKKYKDVVLEQGKSSKAAVKLRKEVKKLDKQLKEVDESAGQFQRSVGNYPDTLGNAAKSLAAVTGAALSLSGAFDAVKGGLDSTEEGSENVRELGSKIGAAYDVAANAVSAGALDFMDWVSAVQDARDAGGGIFDSMGATSDQTKRLGIATEDLTGKYKEQEAAALAVVQAQIKLEKTTRINEILISALDRLIDKQQSIAGDSTRSFEELNNAVLKSSKLQQERANINIEIAQDELDIVNMQVAAKEKLGGATADLLDQQTEAILKVRDAERESLKEQLDNEVELRQIKQDRLERDLDILLDGYDNQKTINERIIANDKETIETRQDLLDETIQKGNKSFAGQVEILQRLTKNKVDYNELLSIDATELNQRIRSLGASEIIEGRILEVIRDRKTELNDLVEAQQDLNDAINENLDLNADITAQYDKLLGKIKDIDAVRLENEKESLKRQIKQLNDGSNEQLRLIQEYNEILLGQQEEYESAERDRLDKNAKAKADAEQKRRDEEIEQDKLYQDYLDEQAEKQRLKEIENREKTLSVLEALNTKYFNDKKAQADQELADAKEREDALTELANNGNKDAAESLAVNQKAQAEANKKKEDLIKKEKAFETALAIIQSYNAALDEGDSNSQALAKAITSVSVLTSIASSLPSFYDGTEDTGTVSKPLDSNGGRLSLLHDNERVVDKQNNDKMGGVSNDDVADIVQSYNKGLLTDVTAINTPHISLETKPFESNEAILEKFDNLENSIVSAIENKETYLGSDVDVMKEILAQYYKKNGTKTIVKSKVKIF